MESDISYWFSEKKSRSHSGADTLLRDFPVPAQIGPNGEYNPLPQTESQKKVEGRIKELADQYAHRLNMDRRTFLKTASGMAVAFLAMNEVFGPVWQVSEAEAADRDLSDARAKALKKQFILDDQTHFVRDDFDKEGLLGLGKYAVEHWNPDMIRDIPLVLQRYKFQNYLKEIFIESDTKVAMLTSIPFDDPSWWLLSNEQIVQARTAVNKIAGSRRLMGHAVITPGQPGWMDEVDRAISELKPDGWKCSTIGDPLSPSSKGTSWRLDDEKLVYPWYEKAVKSGIRNITVRKGLLPRDYETSWAGAWRAATVEDLPKAAKDWPQLNFVISHGALRMFLEDPAHTLHQFEKTGRIDWTTDVCELSSKHGCKNVYADLSTAFASVAVASPRLGAAMIGQMVNCMGADHVVWGTDSVFYGSPQWQIEAMRRLDIPDDIMKKMGWKTKLGAADGKVKNMIFGENSARLYKVRIPAPPPPCEPGPDYEECMKRRYQGGDLIESDKLSEMKDLYLANGIGSSCAS